MLSEFLANHPSIQAALPILIDAALKGAILVSHCRSRRVGVAQPLRRFTSRGVDGGCDWASRHSCARAAPARVADAAASSCIMDGTRVRGDQRCTGDPSDRCQRSRRCEQADHVAHANRKCELREHREAGWAVRCRGLS